MRRIGAPLGDAGQIGEQRVDRRAGAGVRRREEDLGQRRFLEPEIGARVEPHNVEPRLDQRDEGQELIAIASTFIEPARLDIGGRHHHDVVRQQAGEETREDGRVGDVGHREFVEAQNARLLREIAGDARQRIGFAGAARAQQAAREPRP